MDRNNEVIVRISMINVFTFAIAMESVVRYWDILVNFYAISLPSSDAKDSHSTNIDR